MTKPYLYYGNGWYQLSDLTFAKRDGDETLLLPGCFDDDEGNQRKKRELDEILENEKLNCSRTGA